MIEVIHATPRGPIITSRGVLTVVSMSNRAGEQLLEKKMKIEREPIDFGDEDLEGTV